MQLSSAPVLILALGAAIVGYGVWYQLKNPSRVVATGSIQVPNAHGATPDTLQLDTLVIAIGTIRREQVRSPGGIWFECNGDCRQAVRAGITHVFEEQQLGRR
jgi:hypothetical protein